MIMSFMKNTYEKLPQNVFDGDRSDENMEMVVGDFDLLNTLKKLKIESKVEFYQKVDNLQENLNIIKDNGLNLKVLGYLRDYDRCLYDTVLNLDIDDVRGMRDQANNHKPPENQLNIMLVNLTLHKDKINKTYDQHKIRVLAKTLKFYRLGERLGFAFEAWNIFVCLSGLFIGYVIIFHVIS